MHRPGDGPLHLVFVHRRVLFVLLIALDLFSPRGRNSDAQLLQAFKRLLLILRQGFFVDIVRAVHGVNDPVGFFVEEIRIVGIRMPQPEGQALPAAQLIALF